MTDLPDSRKRPKAQLPLWAGPIVLLATAVAMLIWTWGRYCHPFVDFGREIYVAWRLSAGEVLYRDIDYFNGPLSPYFNSLIFRLFGPSLLVLEIANLLWWGLLVVMAYQLYLAMSDRFAAFVATLTFILLFSFLQLTGTGNFNFVTPYAHEMTHALVCAFAVLTLLWRYLRDSRPVPSALLFGCGLLMGAMFLMKVEVTLATAVSLLVGVVLRLMMRHASPAQWIGTIAIILAAALIPSIITFALLRSTMPTHQALQGLLGAWKYLGDPRLTSNRFYRRVMGTDHVGKHTIAMLQILASDLVLLLPPMVLARWISRRTTNETRWVATLGSAGYVIVVLWIFWDSANWEAAAQPLNLLLIAIVLSFASLIAYHRATLPPRLILQLCFSLFAAAMLAKNFFNVAIFHYGFALTAPAFALMVMLLLAWIPQIIYAAGGVPWIFRAAALTAIGSLCLRYLTLYQQVYRSHAVETIGSGGDKFGVYQDGEEINAVLSYLSQLPKNKTVATIPQGAMINYLARRANPTGELTLLPGEVIMFGDNRILGRFQDHPPDYFVEVKSNMNEFGYVGFGVDYAQDIVGFIKHNYVPVPIKLLDTEDSDLHLIRFDPKAAVTQPTTNSAGEDASHH